MSPRGPDDIWSTVGAVPPYVRPAPEPGPRADGLTGNWAAAVAEAREMRAAALAPEPAGPRHARRHAFAGVLARGAAAVLILLGTILVAAGAAVKEWVA